MMEEAEEKKKYIAHVNSDTGEIQLLSEHLQNVALLCKENCPLPELKNTSELTGRVHDIGKFREAFQDYLEDIGENGDAVAKRSINHTTAGGRYVWHLKEKAKTEPKSKFVSMITVKLISTAVYSHHGLLDVVSPIEGEALHEVRDKKEIDYENTMQRCFEEISERQLQELFQKSEIEVQKIAGRIGTVITKDQRLRYGSRNYYLGMYERVLQSLLLDSDWSDTASNARKEPLPRRISTEATAKIWEECSENLEEKLAGFRRAKEVQSSLNRYRQEIADQCKEAAESECSLYRLTVPTGAGKTLSSLRFALNHAKKYGKRHIIYVAPYNSILEQNAEVIREALGNAGVVLEHHCNVVIEDEKENADHQRLTENWDSPIIVTTAVQLLNALFSGSKRDVRRMYALCDSVLILDEVQAIPLRCTELFSLAMNFLSAFGRTTVVLCSATQPSLVPLQQNCLLPCREMIPNLEEYSKYFERTRIIDRTNLVKGGMSIGDLKEFVDEQYEKYKRILIIVNTKSCAAKLYKVLKEEYGKSVWHLSTWMCAEHRKDVLGKIREELDEQEHPVICVSTQLVEAGVDFSFDCVIRSMAGLDSVIQAAGRCNRHKMLGMPGLVYIVRMNQEAESLTYLKEIKDAQNALEQVLYEYERRPEVFGHRLDSQEAIRRYYAFYYQKKVQGETAYPCKEPTATLTDLLSDNQIGLWQYEQINHRKIVPVLNQAFRTAGEKFQVIPEDQKIEVVVEYKDAGYWLEQLDQFYLSQAETKQILRQLQKYTVGISESQRKRFGNAISQTRDKSVLILAQNYYDDRLGVVEEPVKKTLIM